MKSLKRFGLPVALLAVWAMLATPVWATCRVVRRNRVRVIRQVKVVKQNVFFAVPVQVPVYLQQPYVAPQPAPVVTAPAAPAAVPADPPPAYDPPPAPRRASPPPPAYEPPAPAAPRAAPGYGGGNDDRILSALERLESRMDDIEGRLAPRAKPRAPAYDPMPPAEDDEPEVRAPVRKKVLPGRPITRAQPASDAVRVNAIIVRSCSACHSDATAQKSGNGFVLVRQGRMIAMTPRQKQAVVAELTGATMPPRPIPPMAVQDRDIVLRFMRSGA